MKTMDRLYERLTPTERFKIAVAAFGRETWSRLTDSTTRLPIEYQGSGTGVLRTTATSHLADPVLHHPRTRPSTRGLAFVSAMSIQLLQSDSRRDKGELRDDDDAKFEELVD